MRPDTFTGVSVPPVSLNDAREHEYRWPAPKGVSFAITIDTQPSGKDLDLRFEERLANGKVATSSAKKRIRTPYVANVSASQDCRLHAFVVDPNRANLTLAKLSVKASKQTYPSTSFTVYVHVAGDSFAGLGRNGDLASPSDVSAFVGDLIRGTNGVLSPTGIQIDALMSGQRRLTNAQVSAKVPGLVASGFTLVNNGAVASVHDWASLKIDGSDPQFGRALDVFVVHSLDTTTTAPFGGITSRGSAGGGFRSGFGHIAVALFDGKGKPVPAKSLYAILAHEVGHFLTLDHTTDSDFTPDDLVDTPAADKRVVDLNGSGKLDFGDKGAPDESNYMFPFLAPSAAVWSVDQIDAMRGYLAIVEH